MKIKYKEGDVFFIPLGNEKYSICQVVWAPKNDYKKVFSFCVLENNKSSPEWDITKKSPVSLKDNDKITKVVFTGVQKIINGEWGVIGYDDLSDDVKKLNFFHIAGALHNGNEFIRKLDINEYKQYPPMSVFGFELVKNILIDS